MTSKRLGQEKDWGGGSLLTVLIWRCPREIVLVVDKFVVCLFKPACLELSRSYLTFRPIIKFWLHVTCRRDGEADNSSCRSAQSCRVVLLFQSCQVFFLGTARGPAQCSPDQCRPREKRLPVKHSRVCWLEDISSAQIFLLTRSGMRLGFMDSDVIQQISRVN